MNNKSSNTQLQIFFYVTYPKSGSKGVVCDIQRNSKSWKHLFMNIFCKVCVANVHRLALYAYLAVIDAVCHLYGDWSNLLALPKPQMQGLTNSLKMLLCNGSPIHRANSQNSTLLIGKA